VSEQELRRIFEEIIAYIEVHHGMFLDVDLVIDHNGSYPKPRDYAKTSGEVIYVSPKILSADRERVLGLLYHEIGHVLLMQQGDYDHSELHADYIAELCFSVPIYYDIEGVQTIRGGERPRPPHLPK